MLKNQLGDLSQAHSPKAIMNRLQKPTRDGVSQRKQDLFIMVNPTILELPVPEPLRSHNTTLRLKLEKVSNSHVIYLSIYQLSVF